MNIRAIATVSALGLFLVARADAAALNTNLVANGSFESVTGDVGSYASQGVTDWTPGFPVAAAYNYDTGYAAGNPAQVPGFAGIDAGTWFYWGGGTGASFTVSQDIDVSTGATAAAIAAGAAQFNLSAFFSSYASQGDHALIRATFLDAASNVLGSSADIGGADAVAQQDPFGNAIWGYEMTSGLMPVGTASVTIDIESVRLGGGYNDAYVDLVEFSVAQTAVPLPAAAWLMGSALFGLLGFARRRA